MSEEQKSNPQEQALALAKSPRSIRDLIQSDQFANAVKAGLPKHITVQRFTRIALNATMRQPQLLDCTKESFFLRMLELSALGIEPDGRRAHLIPFQNNRMCGACGHEKERHQRGVCKVPGCKNKDCGNVPSAVECTLIIDYKGLAELVRRSGDVSYMHCDVVYGGDKWDFEYGTNAHLTHKPNLEKQDRNLVLAIYSYVKLRDGNEDFIVLSPREVEDIRSQSKYPNGKPWKEHWPEMAKKSAFRRHSKWLPLSAEVRDAIEADDDGIDIEGAFTVAAESVDTDRNRMEEQMRDQAEAERQRESCTDEQKAKSDDSRNADPQQPAGDAPQEKRGRWATREAMITTFSDLRELLGDVVSRRIRNECGVASDEDLGLQDMATEQAYLKLTAALPQGDPPEEPDFRRKGNR